jgi:hypothetical protein
LAYDSSEKLILLEEACHENTNKNFLSGLDLQTSIIFLISPNQDPSSNSKELLSINFHLSVIFEMFFSKPCTMFHIAWTIQLSFHIFGSKKNRDASK